MSNDDLTRSHTTISTIIPAHNAADYIQQTLNSIAAQTFKPTEIILIDDASTDNSTEIARQTAANSELNLRVLSVNVKNAATARNAGIAVATGGWIAFLDADDIWRPNHLQQALELLTGTNDVAYMANHDWLRNGTPQPIPESLRPKRNRSGTGLAHLYFAELMSQGFHFGHSTVLYQADRLREVGGFDESQLRRHDIDLWLRVVANHTWAWGNEPAAHYRIDTPGSISKNTIDAEYYYLRALLRNAADYRSVAMQSLINTCARRATSLAFVDGTQEQYNRVRPLAWPYLPAAFRAAYQVGNLFRPGLRGAVRLKRRAYWSRANWHRPANGQAAAFARGEER